MGVIDLTEDDVELDSGWLSARKPSAIVAKQHTANNSAVIQNNHKIAGQICFCNFLT